MYRRHFLAIVGGSVAAFAGCSSDSTTTETATTSDAVSVPDRRDSILIENHENHSRTVRVLITTADDNVTRFSGRYNIPSQIGIEVPNIGRVGKSYTVVVTPISSNQNPGETEWTVYPCIRDGETATNENTNLFVHLWNTEIGFSTNGCDAIVPSSAEFSYQNHSEYRSDN